jgi:hypothetical protein
LDPVRPRTYARTTPETPTGLAVFVAVFTVIMAPDHMGSKQARQRLLDRLDRRIEVAMDALLTQ